MKFTLTFNSFINEQTTDDPNDRVKKNTALNYDKLIKEYNSKKTEILNFFGSDKLDEEDIQKQLKRYVNEKGVFKNDLIRMWWEICNIEYQIKIKERQIKGVQSDVKKQDVRLDSSETESKPKMQQIITNLKGISSNYTKDIQELQERLVILGKDIKKKLQEYQNQSSNIKKDLLRK